MYILTDAQDLNHPVYDIFGVQYFIAIGAYPPEYFTENSSYTTCVLILYVLSSFTSSIIFFNMIINIMNNTQDRVLDKQERFGLIERTQIYADFMPFVKMNPELKDKSFMYICTKQETEDDDDDWSGGIASIKT